MPETVDRDFNVDRPKTFRVRDHIFTIRTVRPEDWAASLKAAEEREKAANDGEEDGSLEALFNNMDERILLSIPDDEHKDWRELRERKENGVELVDLQSIRDFLTEVHTGRPPQSDTDSSPGPGKTEPSSTEKSSLPAVSRPR